MNQNISWDTFDYYGLSLNWRNRMKKFIKLSEDNNIYIMRGGRERRHTNTTQVGEERILVSEV